jgi:hypothetical protein
MTDALTAPTADAPATAGFRPPPRYRAITGREGSLWDGAGTDSAPLTALVRSNLTGGELDRLRWVRDRMHEAQDPSVAYEALAPYVAAWNAEGSAFDPATGELTWAPLPPPAEAGPAVFERVDYLTVWWLLVNTITAPTSLSPSAAKTSTPSDGRRGGGSSETPPGPSDGPSPTPNRSSRKKRGTSSPTPAAST